MQSTEASERYRAFVALEIPDDARRVAVELQSRLRHVRAKVRWVEPANLHVTLKFLGDVEPERLNRLADRLSEALRETKRVPMTVEGAGAFPDAKRPRVIWAGLREQDLLRGLFEQVDAASAAVGFERDRKPFRAHLTLGRIKRPGDVSSTLDDPSLRGYHSETQPADRVTLFRSQLTPKGAVYSALYQVQLV